MKIKENLATVLVQPENYATVVGYKPGKVAINNARSRLNKLVTSAKKDHTVPKSVSSAGMSLIRKLSQA